jgi:hypothetical protein
MTEGKSAGWKYAAATPAGVCWQLSLTQHMWSKHVQCSNTHAEFCIQQLQKCGNYTSSWGLHPYWPDEVKFGNFTITIFKRSIKENNNSNKSCRQIHDLSLHKTLCKWNSSWIVSIKQTVDFKFQPPAILFFFIFLLNIVHPLKIYNHTKFHGSTFTSKSFASTSEVWMSTILEWLKLWN